jgi:hypothetical protein
MRCYLYKLLRQKNPQLVVLAGLASLAVLLGGCVDKYLPEVISEPQRSLVVDGSISLTGVSTVRLSRTRSLGAGATAPAETKASVAILDEAGNRYPLTEQAAGTYVSASLNLSPSHQYQVRLSTTDGRDYASDLVPANASPTIDNVSWVVVPAGIQISADSHAPTSATRYYRWTYEETWEFYSAYQSDYEYVGGRIVPRTENINHCWHNEESHAILLSNNTSLSQNVLSQFPLTLVAANSERLSNRYSLLAQLHALTADEFAYWEKLRKNTESLGTLFDPLPSQLAGNVHCLSDASELVLGYVGAGGVAERRIFIARTDLPRSISNSPFINPYQACSTDTVKVGDASFYFGGGAYLPIFPANNYLPPTAYSAGKPECVDCRLRGTNIKPSYWP